MINTDTPHLEPELGDAHRMLSLAKFALRREELGLALSDVFARTRVSVRNLTALEQGDFASLPVPVYTRDFIRQYAKLLDINPLQALQEYDDYLKSIANQIVVAENSEPKADTSQSISPKYKSSRGLFFSVILMIALGGLLVFLLEKNTAQQTQRARDAKDKPLQEEGIITIPASEPVKKDTGNAAVASVSAAERKMLHKALKEAASAITVSGPLKLTIKARETTWIGVRIDDQDREQATTLYTGGTATFTGNRFWLNIGNAGGTDVFLQGNPLPSLGKKDEAIRIVLPPKN